MADPAGTDRFMAPEIVRDEAMPSVATDLYSLAVLLFYLLMVSHPLEGQRMLQGDVFGREEAAELYGWHPLFVFDPVDPSNAPDPDRHRNAWLYWPLYPLMLRDLFVRAFTNGLRDPDGGRVRESEWRDGMARLLDLLIRGTSLPSTSAGGSTPTTCAGGATTTGRPVPRSSGIPPLPT